MKKVLAGAIALAATMAFAVPSASAATPDTVICAGGGTSDGSFEAQQLQTGLLAPQACLVLTPDAIGNGVTQLLDQLASAELPSGPPSEEQINAIIEDLESLDPSNPLGALLFLTQTCDNLNSTGLCNAIIGGALGFVLNGLPLGNATLTGEEGFCFQGSQSGSGNVFGGGAFYQLDWTADYGQNGADGLGQLSGTATSGFGSNAVEKPITGFVGPFCGAGAKLLVMSIG